MSEKVAKGDIAEAKVLASLLKKGYNVLLPWKNDLRYDLAIDVCGVLKRIQVKNGILRPTGAISFKTTSTNNTTKAHERYVDQVEFFGVYCPDNDKSYLVPMSIISNKYALYLRIDAPRNNNKNVTWAKNYEL